MPRRKKPQPRRRRKKPEAERFIGFCPGGRPRKRVAKPSRFGAVGGGIHYSPDP